MSWDDAQTIANAYAPPEKPPSRGHLRGKVRDDVDWGEVEDAYVWGSEVTRGKDGNFTRTYPTYHQLSARFNGVSISLISYHAKRGNWAKRREDAAQMTREEFKKQLDEGRAKAAGRKAKDVFEVLEDWIALFAEQVRTKKIKADSVADLNTILRLRAFLKGEADTRSEQKVVHSLDELTRRHLAHQRKVPSVMGPASGVTSGEVEAEVLEEREHKAGKGSKSDDEDHDVG